MHVSDDTLCNTELVMEYLSAAVISDRVCGPEGSAHTAQAHHGSRG